MMTRPTRTALLDPGSDATPHQSTTPRRLTEAGDGRFINVEDTTARGTWPMPSSNRTRPGPTDQIDGPGGALPLRRHQLLRTRDAELARDALSAMCDHYNLRVVGAHERFEARHNAVSLGEVTLSALDYGADVQITPDYIADYYQLHIPLRGTAATVGCGRDVVTASPATAAVAQPHQAFGMRCPPGTPQLLVYLDGEELRRTLWQMLGREPSGRLVFDLGQDLTTPAMRGWFAFVQMVCRDIDHGYGLINHPLTGRHMRQLLATSLLAAARHSHSASLCERSTRSVTKRHVQEAMDYIARNACTDITTLDVAAYLGLSAEHLQDSFREHVGVPPMTYLRQVRLERVHEALVAAAPGAGVTVADIATRWGFTHLGRFPGLYKRRYGRLPSDTLRAAPAAAR